MGVVESFLLRLRELDITGRDYLYSHLIAQEIPFWMTDIRSGGTVTDDEVQMFIDRRGFNDEEARKFRSLAQFLNDNAEAIRQIEGQKLRKGSEG